MSIAITFHGGPECGHCGVALALTQESTFTPDGGRTWLNAAQAEVLVCRCVNKHCPRHNRLLIYRAEWHDATDEYTGKASAA